MCGVIFVIECGNMQPHCIRFVSDEFKKNDLESEWRVIDSVIYDLTLAFTHETKFYDRNAISFYREALNFFYYACMWIFVAAEHFVAARIIPHEGNEP